SSLSLVAQWASHRARTTPGDRRDRRALGGETVSAARRDRSTSSLYHRMAPTLDRLRGRTDATEPVKQADREKVERDDPDPFPHALDSTSTSAGPRGAGAELGGPGERAPDQC